MTGYLHEVLKLPRDRGLKSPTVGKVHAVQSGQAIGAKMTFEGTVLVFWGREEGIGQKGLFIETKQRIMLIKISREYCGRKCAEKSKHSSIL